METVVPKPGYACSFTLKAPGKEIFNCITSRLSDWWTTDIEGSTKKSGDIFTVHFGTTYKTMKVTDLIPHETIVWKCLDSHIDLARLKDKNEWKGTKIVWEIYTESDSTKITMTHVGLNPDIECFDECQKGWEFFLHESLYKLLTTGKGQPYSKS
jgi:hypothetical protein